MKLVLVLMEPQRRSARSGARVSGWDLALQTGRLQMGRGAISPGSPSHRVTRAVIRLQARILIFRLFPPHSYQA